jgi:hypothetical protein
MHGRTEMRSVTSHRPRLSLLRCLCWVEVFLLVASLALGDVSSPRQPEIDLQCGGLCEQRPDCAVSRAGYQGPAEDE